MLEYIHNWEVVTQDKKIVLFGLLGLKIHNTGDVPFVVCGKTFVAGTEYEAPIYGVMTDFVQEIMFKDVSGNKSATLEYVKLKNNTICKE